MHQLVQDQRRHYHEQLEQKCYRVSEGLLYDHCHRYIGWLISLFFFQLLSKVDWTDFDISGTNADRLKGSTWLGRVVEESSISYQSMGITALSLAAIGVAAGLARTGRLRLR